MPFRDTGYHFPETIGTRDAVGAVYPVNLINVTPTRAVPEQDAELGPRLYGRNPDLCCYLRKVVPLERALDPYDAWVTGVRREETSTRSDTHVVEWDAQRAVIKVNPIASWTQEQVEAYIAGNGVLVNPLVDEGYPSIGCAPCTMRVGSSRGRIRGAAAGPRPGQDRVRAAPLIVPVAPLAVPVAPLAVSGAIGLTYEQGWACRL
jgi:phosphoadenosine phosphosulfate reductase